MRVFDVGESLMIRNYVLRKSKMVYWCNTYLRDVLLLHTYQVKMHSGLIWRHHTNQLHAVSDNINSNCDYTEALNDVLIVGIKIVQFQIPCFLFTQPLLLGIL